MFKTMLCAIDGSAATERLLLYVMHFGKTEQVDLRVVHAFQLPDYYAAQEGYDALAMAYSRVAQNVVQDALHYLQETQIEATGEALEGEAADVILSEAQRIGADLILIGRSAASERGQSLLGSVSQQVLNAAHIPVLVIP